MEQQFIRIKNARVNNLKNISLQIPRDKFIVITGVSGSGKSSLAFDTLFAEGQRRYVESLSAYARQFLGRMSKPECDFIEGLPPAIAIEQKVIARNPRSTVGTSTEIYEYLRMLYARIGHTYSPVSGQEVKKHSIEDILHCVQEFSEGTRFMVLAPLHVIEGRTPERQLQMYAQEGYSRVLVGKEVSRIEDLLEAHTDVDITNTYLIVDRLSVSQDKSDISRLFDSCETAFYEGDGSCRISFLPSGISYDFSTRFEADGITFEEPTDNMFAFNSPAGACPRCEGFGSIIGVDERLVIPDTTRSVYDGCVQCWHGEVMKKWQTEFCRRAAKDNFPIFKPFMELSRKEKDMLWHGLPSDRRRTLSERACIDGFFQMVQDNIYKIQYRVLMSRYRGRTVCPDCHGTRLRKEASWVKIAGRSIADLVEMPIGKLKEWFDNLSLPTQEQEIGQRLLKEINTRLQFLVDVGLDYLTLNRPSNTLSGGESQRINLTTSIGSSLVGSLYILDEPSIGLHSRDTARLIKVLHKLQAMGNTVIVVEHDEEIMRAADWLIDVGPEAGRLGGEIVYQGPVPLISEEGNPKSEESNCNKDINNILSEGIRIENKLTNSSVYTSHTLDYLSGAEAIPLPASRRPWNLSITVKGARMNNLQGIDVTFPLNVLTVVTGVSGSGKSSLIKGILFPALKRRMDEVANMPGEFAGLEGDMDSIKHVEFVDQNPIGKSTRSNPATYVKAYDEIRRVFADQPLSKQMGFTAAHFSFNADGGRCEECKGAGVITVEMQFMADLTLTCDACHGQRFKKDILEVRFHGKSINDVLGMTVSEAINFFGEHGEKGVVNRLRPLEAVGLGYIKLGQNSSSLSGGENQRVKLAYFIGQEKHEPTLFIFDEPTTGLHFHDIQRLLSAFYALIDRGHSILVIEHNLDVVKCADYVIDLGPEGGDKGGRLVTTGTPEELASCAASITGKCLKPYLKKNRHSTE